MLDDDGWPSWLREAFDFMEGKRLGSQFMCAMEWWTVLERAHKFETSAKGLGTDHRPPEVHHWLRVLRRNLHKPPNISDEHRYSASWWQWWAGLQPDWRHRDEGGRPILGGSGDWEVLTRPGRNGLLIVLLSLVWWHDAAEGTRSEWEAAVKDVSWVVACMAQQALEGEENDGHTQ
ncbi:hypothetical protein C2E23DRAFT_730876 [Lenzites betulinus]|nr:hypothetical protein C2E23DRAFT_730876 [Lenzites betulinus]